VKFGRACYIISRIYSPDGPAKGPIIDGKFRSLDLTQTEGLGEFSHKQHENWEEEAHHNIKPGFHQT